MSIKKLFDSTEKSKNYLTEKTDKTAFEDVESSRNLAQIRDKQEHFQPQIDYTNPEKFARFGSALLYYKSAFTRILDYYPYDGSDAEINKFYNGCLDIERNILDTEYPRTNGYITMNVAGYGSTVISSDGYNRPAVANEEHIDFYGGPGTGSVTSTALKDLAINKYNDDFNNANIYDTELYQTNGLPSTYGKGTRVSNLAANFDEGVTVEFWFKSGSSPIITNTTKQVLFDWWNNEETSSADYGRILIELTSSQDSYGVRQRPFLLTVQSGAVTSRNLISIGSASLTDDINNWHHYAVRLKNSGSGRSRVLGAQLYVDGGINDEIAWDSYTLTSAFVSNTYKYKSQNNLQGWWRLDEDLDSVLYARDYSGKGRAGSTAFGYRPVGDTTNYPSTYIQTTTNEFSNDFVDIGTSLLWNNIIGTGSEGPGVSPWTTRSEPRMSFSAWVRKTGDGSSSYPRIIDFGNQDIAIFSTPDEKITFSARWNGSAVNWTTAAAAITEDTWHHIIVTYNIESTASVPILYIDGVATNWAVEGTPTGDFSGISGDKCMIGNREDTGVFDRDWQGQLADIAVWDSILAPAEVLAIYHASDYSKLNAAIGTLTPKNAVGRIGALLTSPAGSSAPSNSGKLSGSLDEFRYWKVARSAREIGIRYFTQVRGGTNTDISNTTLGVYYKFNEGITGDNDIDRSVLDYAGRVTNGVWTGYIVSASAAPKEYKDPIIRPNHPDVISLRSTLVKKGEGHDLNNNSSMLSLLPGWIVDDEEVGKDSDLQNMCHIIGAYFDTLYLQISQISKLKHLTYTSSSHKPIPFAEHLPQSLGLYSPELFIDATVMEKFTNRNTENLFEGDLHDTKNLIYSNIYNNLTSIFKAKGTEKAIRNIFRCFNVDEKLLRLTINSNREEYTLRNNIQQTSINKNCANFNTASHINSVIYQRSSSAPGWASTGYITGSSKLNPYGFTAEANIIFPHFNNINDKVYRNFQSSSLFGATTVLAGVATNLKGEETTFPNGRPGISNADDANFQVSVVKEDRFSKNAFFVLESRYAGDGGTVPFPTLTSSTFVDVYDNQTWNVSVRLRPKDYPIAGHVQGALANYPYVLEFHGINTVGDTIANSFKVTSSVSWETGSLMNQAGKRLYVGALRTNLTGTVLAQTDVLISSAKYWTKYLKDSTLKQHTVDVENIGISGSFLPITPSGSGAETDGAPEIFNSDMLALNWNFGGVTGSNAAGNFYVQDFSSGSLPNSQAFKGKDWIAPITKYQHPGYGYGFNLSSTTVMDKRTVNTCRFINPEHVVSSDMIRIFDDEDKLYPPTEFIPNYVYTLEKSLYNSVSEEMLDFFAGVVDFNTLIGAPVNRYRSRYKALEAMREIFFRRVSEVKQVEKYLKYYQWFDDALSTLVGQLVPASAEYVDDVLNVVESHVLERPKYQSRFPTLAYFDPDVAGFMQGYEAAHYPPRLGSTTIPSSPRLTTKHEFFWKARAERASPEITSGDPIVDAQREKLRKIIYSQPRLSASAPVLSSSEGGHYYAQEFKTRAFAKVYNLEAVSESIYRGGVNFSRTKNLGFARASVWPAGPINTEEGVFIPENVLIAVPEDYVETTNWPRENAPPKEIQKVHRVYKVQSGRDWQSGRGYYNMKSTMALPFSIMSSSVSGGYVNDIHLQVTGGIDIVNLHNDVYGPLMEKPMQGPFTEALVGGSQSRHIPINFNATDTWHTRPEAFRILIGSCLGPPGAIGVVGPDYPWPEANNEGETPYPITGSKKAYLFRDMVAKRPVNFKNIKMEVGKSLLGNYTQEYEVLNSCGTYQNPRHFIDNQPPLPSKAFVGPIRYATQMRTYLDIRRTENGHVQLLPDYSVAYLTGTQNQQIITTRFSNPGNVQTMGVGYRDIRGNEYSIYNSTGYRTLSFSRTSQMPSGTIPEAPGIGTPGIRLFDLHGKDIGEYAHRARHSAKFGRDSVYASETVPVTGQPAAYGLTASMEPRFIKGPLEYGGAGYGYTQQDANALQGWWRLNTNISSTGDATDSSGNGHDGTFDSASDRPEHYTAYYPPKNENNSDPISYIQTAANYFSGSSTATRINIGNSATWDAIIGNNTLNGSTQKMTFAAWVWKWSDGGYFSGRIVDFGDDIVLYTTHDEKIVFQVKWNGASKRVRWITTTKISIQDWYHVAVTYDANDVTNQPIIYINGQKQPVYTYSGVVEGTYYGVATSYDCYIGNISPSSPYDYGFNGFISDLAVWNQTLSDGAIRAIYHAGMHGLTETNPNAPGASYDQLPARYKIHRNSKSRIQQLGDGTYVTSSRYDNYNVQHQIPQSDLQYNWIANSVVDPNSTYYFGFQKTYGGDRSFKSSSISGLSPYWTFVSASDVEPIIESSGGYGRTQVGKSAFGGGYQPIARINTITLDAVSGNTNTLGFPSDATAPAAYLNDTLNNTEYIQSASYLNMLLSRRQATYGWTWQMWRTARYHPVLIEEMKNNQLSVVTGGAQGFYNFSLPPVSLKGRTSRVNYDSPYSNPIQLAAGKRNNITLKASHTNEKIFFNQVALNNLASPDLKAIYTPLYMAIDMVNKAKFSKNWIIYTQNIFPSTRNEFTTRSSARPDYDNGFWRNSNAARVTLAAGKPNSFGVGLGSGPPGSKYYLSGFPPSQSAWVLDAPIDFLTRSVPPAYVLIDGQIHFSCARRFGNAGELQNTFSQYTQGAAYAGSSYAPGSAARYPFWRYTQLLASPLYSRKHMLSSPRAVVAPSGLNIPQTGAVPTRPEAPAMLPGDSEHGAFGIAEFRAVSASQAYTGEALWEANRTAGIIQRTPKHLMDAHDSGSTFFVSASNPWFNDYDAFHADLKLIARGYSIVPEFRISDHVEDYLKFGILDPGNLDTFKIPGTIATSATASFYKDYSNSDFLQDFMNIKDKTMLDLNEIKITCEAAIRFNPYKGFYPAQRTLDLVSQFSRSYGPGMSAIAPMRASAGNPLRGVDEVTGSTNSYQWLGSSFRPLITPLFAPGILYNSIKSGMAVDYPVVTSPERIARAAYGGTHDSDSAVGPELGYSPDNWALTTYAAQVNDANQRFNGGYFDFRMPFEAIIEPDSYLKGKFFIDMEPHPSCSLPVTASWAGDPEQSYTKMAANFFGEVGNFFLKDKDFTNLESSVVPTDLKFSEGEVYGARLVLKRSMQGPRGYGFDSGSTGDGTAFTKLGGKTFIATDPTTSFASGTAGGYTNETYAIPQDPKRNSRYRENFTMYSRPTAFGPPLTGRAWSTSSTYNTGSLGLSGSVDCFDGYNWAYTPPYYHGEAWVDLVFRPSASISYDLEKILAETKTYYWRADPGAPSGSSNTAYYTSLIPGGPSSPHGATQGVGEPYAGDHVNNNAMQLSASFNLFGIERVFKTQGRGGVQTNETIGAKWIIQPKFETPMLDFGDVGLHPNTSGSGNLTVPMFGSASVPRGMWHQFGKMPVDKNRGIFLSIGEIPSDWLNNHWAVINSASIYNDYSIPTGNARFSQGDRYKSLSRLFGFDRKNSKIRLGELAESQVIREAVVAVPYVLEQNNFGETAATGSQQITAEKKLISIPRTRIEEALGDLEGSVSPDSGATGVSIRKLVKKMNRYILPPQFDFLNNKKIDPMVMYLFEFRYKLDKDDLSYIWQNLAPRDYQKITFQKTSVAHELFDTELLNERNLLNNPDLRWMVFKVKQRGQVEYWDLIADQAREASTQIFGDLKKQPEGYDIAYNWPYDFVSFVEAIKIDVDVMYKDPGDTSIKQTEIDIKKAAIINKDAKIQERLQNKNKKKQ